MSKRSNRKPTLGVWSTSKKHVTSISFKLEPAIWSDGHGGYLVLTSISYLTINIKEGRYKPRVHVSVNLLTELWPPSCRLRRGRHRVYAPTRSTASHDNHREIDLWVPFSSFKWVWGLASRPFGLLELTYN